jgi:Na+/H+ antiporter NhaD/arsenite permease-like protein
MDEGESSVKLSSGALAGRLLTMLAASLGVGIIGASTVFNVQQASAVGVFVAIIMGTLFFWNFRLAIAFLGLAVLICSKSLTIGQFVVSSSLEVILFLVGMMIIVGALRDLGFFTWIVQMIVSMPNISGRKFIMVTAIASALLACAVDEVTSIIFVSALIFQVCDRLKLNPTPYIIISVLCTNVGSAGTMMGNPVGIYIGTKGGLSFGDFMLWSFPVMLVALLVTAAVTLLYYRKEVAEFDLHMKARLARNLTLAPAIKVPYRQGLALLLFTVLAISLHVPLERLMGLQKNSVLLIAPLVCAGIVMIIRRERARHYVERDVDWWTLLFFMLLFAIAGTLEHTHVDRLMASHFSKICGTSHAALVPFIMVVSALGSAFVDNVIFVAAFSPVIEQLSTSIKDLPLWWALLFGACFGGNITMIGSTANIVALGLIERRTHAGVTFFGWLKIGFISSLLAGLVGWAGIMLLEPLMPDRYAEINYELTAAAAGKNFVAKNVIIPAKTGGPAAILNPASRPEWASADDLAYQLLPASGDPAKAIIAYLPASAAPELKSKLALVGGEIQYFKGKLYTFADSRADYPTAMMIEAVLERAPVH